MSRISIDVTPEEHRKLKALAALGGKSIKDYVIERTLGVDDDDTQRVALSKLELMLEERIRGADNGVVSKRTVGSIFDAAYPKAKAR